MSPCFHQTRAQPDGARLAQLPRLDTEQKANPGISCDLVWEQQEDVAVSGCVGGPLEIEAHPGSLLFLPHCLLLKQTTWQPPAGKKL